MKESDKKTPFLNPFGCPNCGSVNFIEIANNHPQTEDEAEYLEYLKCLDCGHTFVD